MSVCFIAKSKGKPYVYDKLDVFLMSGHSYLVASKKRPRRVFHVQYQIVQSAQDYLHVSKLYILNKKETQQ